MQIVDREKLLNGPKEPTDANLNYPQVGRLELPPTNGAHTTFPMLGMDVAEFAKDRGGNKRDFALIVDESLVNECQEPRPDGVDRRHHRGGEAVQRRQLDGARVERRFLRARRAFSALTRPTRT